MSSKLHRFEPINTQCDEENPQCINMLMDAGWFSFFDKIRGYNVEVTQQFSCKFIGSYVDFKSLSFEVS